MGELLNSFRPCKTKSLTPSGVRLFRISFVGCVIAFFSSHSRLTGYYSGELRLCLTGIFIIPAWARI
jgi:hypothetical protein